MDLCSNNEMNSEVVSVMVGAKITPSGSKFRALLPDSVNDD